MFARCPIELALQTTCQAVRSFTDQRLIPTPIRQPTVSASYLVLVVVVSSILYVMYQRNVRCDVSCKCVQGAVEKVHIDLGGFW